MKENIRVGSIVQHCVGDVGIVLTEPPQRELSAYFKVYWFNRKGSWKVQLSYITKVLVP